MICCACTDQATEDVMIEDEMTRGREGGTGREIPGGGVVPERGVKIMAGVMGATRMRGQAIEHAAGLDHEKEDDAGVGLGRDPWNGGDTGWLLCPRVCSQFQ